MRLLLLALLLTWTTAVSAAQQRVALLGVWDRAMPALAEAAQAQRLPIASYGPENLPSAEQLAGVELVLVLNIHPADTPPLVDRLRKLRDEHGGKPRVFSLDKRGSHAPLQNAGLLETDERVHAYWRPNGNTNLKRLLAYLNTTYLGGHDKIEPPLAIPESGFYLPGHEQAIDTLAEYRAKAGWKDGAPVAALLIQQAFWITQDVKVIDATVDALKRQGFNVATLFAEQAHTMEAMVREVKPDVIVEDRHGRMWSDAGASLLSELDVPYLRPISMLGATIQEWRDNPDGLNPRDRGMFMSLQEMLGTVEPIVVGGLQVNVAGFKLHEPIPDRVQRFAERARAWAELRRTANKDKRVAIVYYNKSLGADDLARGSPTGAFMDGPESLLRVLPRLRDKGYKIDPLPKDAQELIAWMKARGRNYAHWAQADIERMADQPGVVRVPLSRYRQWYEKKLDAAQRKLVEAKHGKAPGHFMLVTRHGEPHIVLPMIRLGNVILTPQPQRGRAEDESLLHSHDLPPPHNYLAFHWWLQEEFKPHAMVPWGTHGSLELLPGKGAGLSGRDWTDMLVGRMPVVYPWIMDNLAEATLARRRAYALIVDHLPPLGEAAALAPELQRLAEDVRKFQTLEQGVLKQEFRKRISAAARAQRIPGTQTGKAPLDDAAVEEVGEWLDRQAEEHTPKTLHVMGEAPADARLIDTLVSSLRQPFKERLAKQYGLPPKDVQERARQFVRDSVLGGVAPPDALAADAARAKELLTNLRLADREITGLLRALEGRYIPGGPGPDPARNPGSVPGGRNLYALNPEEIPTKASYEVAVKLIDDLLKTRKPAKVGIDLNGMDTMRDFGVNEGQILYLLGTRPVWDANGIAVDVELIPRAELKRPRVDVFIAMGGQYKDNFPSRMRLLDKAVKLAASVDEPDNGVRLGSERLRQALLKDGMAPEKAAEFATARLFGNKPGNLNGTNILFLVPRSGVWESEKEIASVYLDQMSFVYTADHWGEAAPKIYKQAIQGTDTLVRVWASNMTSQLSNHHAYEYLGGLSMAVRTLTGKEPAAFIADVRNPDGARMRRFEEVLESNLRSELLDKKWLEGMKAHDYAGAGHMAELVKNTFGWAVTRKSSLDPRVWDDIHATLVKDRYKLGLREWFEKQNPAALQEVTATMMEAARKGYWKADPKVLQELAQIYADLTIQHGASTGLVAGGNAKLEQTVAELAPGQAAAFLAAMAHSRELQDAAQAQPKPEAQPAEGEHVQGKRLAPVEQPPAKAEPESATPQVSQETLDRWRFAIVLGMLFWSLLGVPMRAGAAR